MKLSATSIYNAKRYLRENKRKHLTEKLFEVIGAGKIRISTKNKCQCGGETGFCFGVSWGRYGFSGGVIPNEEARKLAEHILKQLTPPDLRHNK